MAGKRASAADRGAGGSSNPAEAGKRRHAGGRRPATSVPCQVPDCGAELVDEEGFYKRYRVCRLHSREPSVLVGSPAIEQRFCQQCARFHPLADFEGSRRSCRVALARHRSKRRASGSRAPRRLKQQQQRQQQRRDGGVGPGHSGSETEGHEEEEEEEEEVEEEEEEAVCAATAADSDELSIEQEQQSGKEEASWQAPEQDEPPPLPQPPPKQQQQQPNQAGPASERPAGGAAALRPALVSMQPVSGRGASSERCTGSQLGSAGVRHGLLSGSSNDGSAAGQGVTFSSGEAQPSLFGSMEHPAAPPSLQQQQQHHQEQQQQQQQQQGKQEEHRQWLAAQQLSLQHRLPWPPLELAGSSPLPGCGAQNAHRGAPADREQNRSGGAASLVPLDAIDPRLAASGVQWAPSLGSCTLACSAPQLLQPAPAALPHAWHVSALPAWLGSLEALRSLPLPSMVRQELATGAADSSGIGHWQRQPQTAPSGVLQGASALAGSSGGWSSGLETLQSGMPSSLLPAEPSSLGCCNAAGVEAGIEGWIAGVLSPPD